MNLSYQTVNGLKIACNTIHSEKENTIFFIHGNSTSSQTWRKQVESNFLEDYRLITIDLPNHGNSAAMEIDGDYSLPALAKIVGAVINLLINNRPYIICSVSLGTNIVAEMMSGDLSPKGLFLAGPFIVGEGFGMDKLVLPGADPTAVFAENVPKEMVIKYGDETSLSADSNDKEVFLKDYYAVQGNFRSSLYATIAAGNYNDEIAILHKLNCPVCIVFGKEEMIVNTDYLNEAPLNLWNKTIYKLPGASHLVNIDAPEVFNELVAGFATDMFTPVSMAL